MNTPRVNDGATPPSYRVVLTPDTNGTVLVEFPDFPEAHTFGENREDALAHASDALATVIEAYRRDGQTIPEPSPGDGPTVTPTNG